MTSRPEQPSETGTSGRERAFDGFEGYDDDVLEFSGPGVDDDLDGDEQPIPDPHFPGGVDHTTAAAGAGALGIALLGIFCAVRRRRARRRMKDLDA